VLAAQDKKDDAIANADGAETGPADSDAQHELADLLPARENDLAELRIARWSPRIRMTPSFTAAWDRRCCGRKSFRKRKRNFWRRCD